MEKIGLFLEVRVLVDMVFDLVACLLDLMSEIADVFLERFFDLRRKTTRRKAVFFHLLHFFEMLQTAHKPLELLDL